MPFLETFHEKVEITVVRKSDSENEDLYGSYFGIDGLKVFLTRMGNSFDTKSFSIEKLISESDVAFANGQFTHKVKATDKSFHSNWALCVTVNNGKISSYKFYEDSAAFEKANSK